MTLSEFKGLVGCSFQPIQVEKDSPLHLLAMAAEADLKGTRAIVDEEVEEIIKFVLGMLTETQTTIAKDLIASS
jgi:hypothetical protein